MNIRTKILSGFFVVITLMGIFGVVTYLDLHETSQEFRFLIEHDLKVLQNAQKLQKLIIDAETGQRGFIIVGQDEFLEPYYLGTSGFKELLEIEKKLVSDNPPQVKKLEKIDELFDSWLEKTAIPQIELARITHETTVESEKEVKIQEVRKLVAKATGKKILDEIRGEFEIFIQIENDLKDSRFDKVKQNEKETELKIIIIILVTITVGIGIAVTLSQSINSALNRLTHGAKLFGEGKFDPIEVIGRDETTELSKRFNEMAVELKTNIEKLETQSNELKNMNQELKKTEILKEEFVAMISHELKTPLTPILMWAGALKDEKFMGALNEKQKKAARTILSCANDLSHLISDIFDSYKLDLEKMEFVEEEIVLTDLMDEIKNTGDKFIEGTKITLENSTKENSTIHGDKKRIAQVLKNLLTNAVDFVDSETGKIEINATTKGENVEFFVKDNGVGIAKEFQDQLFKKFYQIDTSATRKHGGSGLGLSICYGIINGMKGKIWLDSYAGKGTIFYVSLPNSQAKKE